MAMINCRECDHVYSSRHKNCPECNAFTNPEDGEPSLVSKAFNSTVYSDSIPKSYSCPKCGSKTYEMGQIRVSGGFWSSFFDVGNKRYNAVSCMRCGYTEFYKRTVSGVQKVFDFLGS